MPSTTIDNVTKTFLENYGFSGKGEVCPCFHSKKCYNEAFGESCEQKRKPVK